MKEIKYKELRMKLLTKVELHRGKKTIKHHILKLYPKELNKENKCYMTKIRVYLDDIKIPEEKELNT